MSLCESHLLIAKTFTAIALNLISNYDTALMMRMMIITSEYQNPVHIVKGGLGSPVLISTIRK
ncbi:hypothetical protein [Alteromonas macleodii]|uniref:hypothetical protein n=1 Tax=Alteromonas macleodii TaxID=28108 RepID=UPI0015D3AD34|nr:hypothetical protein [Alteromonas macleodii]